MKEFQSVFIKGQWLGLSDRKSQLGNKMVSSVSNVFSWEDSSEE